MCSRVTALVCSMVCGPKPRYKSQQTPRKTHGNRSHDLDPTHAREKLPLGLRQTRHPRAPQLIVHLPAVTFSDSERVQARVTAAQLDLAKEREHFLLRVLHPARKRALIVHARLQPAHVDHHALQAGRQRCDERGRRLGVPRGNAGCGGGAWRW